MTLLPPDRPSSEDRLLTDSHFSLESTQILETNSGGQTPSSSNPRTQVALEIWVGKTIGKYHIVEILGQGGMGIVLKGHDPLIDRYVAIKLLPAEFSTDGVALNRFLSEARAAGKLTHPNVVQIFDVGEINAEYYLVMEFVPGGSVAEQLQKRGPASVFEATRMISDACRGLGAAHAAGLVHRDIKPANLLRSSDGSVKVTDFGIVKETNSTTLQVTRAGVVVGTPYFMSPEQCEGRAVDARSDLYSLGASYYSILTGENPYSDSGSMMQVMFAHCNREPPDPRAINSSVPPACAEIIARAMAKSPANRYQSAAEMQADLQTLLGTLSGVTNHSLWDTQSTKNLRTLQTQSSTSIPNRRSFLIAAGLGGAAVLGGAGAWWLGSKRNDKPSATPLVPVADKSNPIPVGILHSLSGTMANSETAVVDATLFALEEIEKAGGLLGRSIKPIVIDCRSDPNRFATEAEKLITEKQVCTIFGGWTSSSRKMMKPVFEKYDHLLVYPLQYEGLETSPNIVYMGSAPNQQILPAVDWARKTLGKQRFFLIGSDYVFPRAAHAIIRDELAQGGGEVVGETFLKLGTPDVQDAIDAIKASQPDMILNCINGDTNVAFFTDLRTAGITPEVIPTMSFSVGEQELRGFDLSSMQGDYAAWTYFQSLKTPENRQFSELFLERYPQRVLSDPMESAYTGVKLWAQAVAEAEDLKPKTIRRAMLSQRMLAPSGEVRIESETQHCFKTPRIGQVSEDGQFQIVWEAPEPIAPQPFPKTRTAEEWKAFLHDLYSGWGDRWTAQLM
ncbi:transporter substrate-binding protein [Planctomicrobium sp. SH661]|uniref:transporter substrate-binding protein n=1 Tax=Planctomicrobium sp. SH661 TaxID=3448124 RepID=UPI003F5B1A6A